ncbi:potassium channel family protein [Riemerella anatipestifer]|nr:potassium channel family protein [Riemerella anatipestifer]MCU7586323.1 potassium channel family protein [Riemerella anatipestifer]
MVRFCNVCDRRGRKRFCGYSYLYLLGVVTLTTVGYGDISPVTPLGKFLSVILMLCGYSIIAVPTGIVTSEMKLRTKKDNDCERCGNSSNDDDARYCKICGERLKD